MPEGKKVKSNKKEEQSVFSQVPIGGWAVLILIIVGVAAWSFISGLGSYTYEGLAFNKERYGDVIVNHHSYFYRAPVSGQLIQYNLYLREDPRYNDVPVDGEIRFEGRDVVLSIDTEGLAQCQHSILGLSMIQDFFNNNAFNVQVAVSDGGQNEERVDVPLAVCGTHPDRNVVVIEDGFKSEVKQNGDSCYELKVADCEVLPVVEKFVVQSLIDARESED